MWGDRRCAYGVLVGKGDEGRQIVRPKRTWEADTKMGFQEVKGEHGLD